MFFLRPLPSSSNTLKTYFPDVKFNRCVTSQLIKLVSVTSGSSSTSRWSASPGRRSVIACPGRGAPGLGREGREGPGLARDPQVRLGRDTELYRILNMHYNKSNDYQVTHVL
ncbi:prospero homeobox protein 1-like, partial [Osmerus eperlanus]|uniref:prospero homeobox protein 1-like n=1 Tax=Osmerus eperlanus TaxID=29151 RepID=UPI002E147BC5